MQGSTRACLQGCTHMRVRVPVGPHVCLSKVAEKLQKWSGDPKLSCRQRGPGWWCLIVTHRIFMHFTYALMDFIINTINTLILLRHNTSGI